MNRRARNQREFWDVHDSSQQLQICRAIQVAMRNGDDASALQLLLNRDLWNSIETQFQDFAIAEVAKRLGSEFVLQSVQVFQCQTSHRIAVFEHLVTGIEFSLIPGGRFIMGTDSMFPHEGPAHEVTIWPILMARTPVLGEEWLTAGYRESRFREYPRLPVTRVSEHSILQWLEKVASELRLPSESEWEYCCRAGTSTRYFWGDSVDEDYCWFYQDIEERAFDPQLHGEFGNAFGLIDMLGNVDEICLDHYLPNYQNASSNNAARRKGHDDLVVCRGGNLEDLPDEVRCVSRLAADWFLPRVGFRVCKSIPGFEPEKLIHSV